MRIVARLYLRVNGWSEEKVLCEAGFPKWYLRGGRGWERGYLLAL